MKILFYIFLIIMFFAPGLAVSEHDKGNEIPWQYLDHSFLGNSGDNAKVYTLFDNSICNNDNLESLVCIDYGWKNTCLEIFIIYSLTDNIPFIFKADSIPVIQIGGNKKIDINPIIEMENKIKKFIIPRAMDEDFAMWRISVGSLDTHQNLTTGAIYQLLNEDRLNIYFELQNGTVMRSHASLHGLKPLLEGVLEKALAVKPEGPECS